VRRLSPLVHTPCYLAHVRAASPGLPVEHQNCHPFPGGQHTLEDRRDRDPVEEGRQRLLFMHNGHLGGYHDVVRRLRHDLPDAAYFGIRGTTDSEHAFAVYQHHLGDAATDPTLDDRTTALHDTLTYLERRKHDVGATDHTTLANFCLTDGTRLLATRYASPDPSEAESLYLGEAGAFHADGHDTGARHPDRDDATIVASERLFDDDRVWRDVPPNSLVTVDADGETRVEDLTVEV
jgi:glutamine amidotransferase